MTRKKTTRPGSETGAALDVDLGGLFRNIGDFVEVLGKLAEAGDKHIERHGEFKVKGLGDTARGVFGFSVRTGIGGAARVEPFGNIHKTKAGVVVDEAREPLVDVFDEGDELLATAEVPGVKDAEITVTIRGDVLLIETRGDRRYVKEILLPSAVDAATLRRTYNNGILEIRLKKAARGGPA